MNVWIRPAPSFTWICRLANFSTVPCVRVGTWTMGCHALRRRPDTASVGGSRSMGSIVRRAGRRIPASVGSLGDAPAPTNGTFRQLLGELVSLTKFAVGQEGGRMRPWRSGSRPSATTRSIMASTNGASSGAPSPTAAITWRTRSAVTPQRYHGSPPDDGVEQERREAVEGSGEAGVG